MGLLLLSCCGCCCRSRRRKGDDSEDLISAGGGEQDGGAKDVVEDSSDLSPSSDDSSKSLDELNSSRGPSDDLASPREGGPGRRAGVKPLPKKLIGRNWRIPLDYDQRKAIAEYLHQRKMYMRKELEKNRRAKREATDEHLASVRKSYDKATKKLVRQLDPLSAEQRHFCGYDIPVSHKREFELSAETSITVVLDNLHVPEERTFTVRDPVRVFIPVGSASSVGAGAGSAAQLGIHFGLANLRSPSPRRSGPDHGDHDVPAPPASALGDPPAVAGIPPAGTGKSSSKRPDSPSSSTMEREVSGAPSTSGNMIEMDPLEAVPLPADGRQMTKESVASSAPSRGAASAASASSAVAYATSLCTTSQSTGGRPSSPLGSDSISTSNYGINHLGAYEPNDYQDLSRGYWLPGRVTALGTSGEIEVKVAISGPRPLGREVEYLVFLPDQVRMGVLRKFAEENGDTKFRRKLGAATSGMFSSKTRRGGRRQGGGGGGKAKVGAGNVGATSRVGSWMIPRILRGGKSISSKPSGLPPAASPRSPKMGGTKRTRPHRRVPSNFGTTSASGVSSSATPASASPITTRTPWRRASSGKTLSRQPWRSTTISGSSSATRIDPAAKTGVSFCSGGAAATRSTTEGALFGGRGTTTMARSDQFVTTRTVFPTVNNVNITEDSPPGSPQGPASLPGGSRTGSRPGSPKAELSEHHQRAGPLLDEFYVPSMCREEQLQSTGYHLTVGTKFGQRKDLGPKITHMPKWAADLGKPLAMVREPDETAFYVDPGVGDTPLRDPISTYELAFVREKTRLREAVYDQADGGWFRTEPLKRKNIRDKSPPPPRNKVQYEEKKARSQRESLALIDERKVELMPVMPLDEIFKRSGGRVRASEEEQDPDLFGV